MRILGLVKRVVPFVLALALGISVATVFYAFTSVNSQKADVYMKKDHYKKVYKKKKKKKRCRKNREYRHDY